MKAKTFSRLQISLALVLGLSTWTCASSSQTSPHRSTQQVESSSELAAIRAYIKNAWSTLTRSHAQLLAAATDPKVAAVKQWPVYVAADESLENVKATLTRAVPPADFARLSLRVLPKDPSQITEHGILYLPHPYVVPGGRFNEMYGWDSYFILVGLVRDGEIEMAKNMVDNFVYEIEHYGTILNANRSYYLSRSQPPFLTQMIKDVFAQTHDKAWLVSTLPAVQKYYEFWTTEPHLTPATGLARYYDTGKGPAPEVLSGEKDAQGKNHYERIAEFYQTTLQNDPDANKTLGYDVSRFYNAKTGKLTDLFYVADRAMRESGFDPSNRFGQFNIGTIDYDPVCLNSLLYIMEKDMAELYGLAQKAGGEVFVEKAKARAAAINKYMWDEKAGVYFDYDFVAGKTREYVFATTFFPLWAGIASKEQAARIQQNLGLFERAGGLLTSTVTSGNQWDAPFGWAPLQLIAAKGLRRYGFAVDADRITIKFLNLVLKEFVEHGAIFEKYDVLAAESAVSAGIKFGYSSNEIGFGWTNAAFVEMLADLPPSEHAKIKLAPTAK